MGAMLNIACGGLAVKTNKAFFHSLLSLRVMSLGPVGGGRGTGVGASAPALPPD